MDTIAENLETLLRSRRTEDRMRAVQWVARAAAPGKAALLLRSLHDRSPYVAALAAKALGEMAESSDTEGPFPAAELVERFLYLAEDGLKRDPGCHIRAHLAFTMGRLEYAPAIEALRLGIRTVQMEPVGGVPFDTGAHLRANCALALAQLRAPDALRDIALLLFDVPAAATLMLMIEPRKAAAQALARLRDHSALVPLAVRLTYPAGESPEVLQECMQAIVALEDPRALELLQPYLRHADEHLAAFAALMIARIRAPEAPALLREVIQRLSGDPLRAAVLALTTLRSEEAKGVLQELAAHPRQEVRRAVAEVLAEGGDGHYSGAQQG